MISILITLAIFGVILWVINTYIPMDQKIKTLVNVIAIIAVCLWLLRAFGIWHGGPSL